MSEYCCWFGYSIKSKSSLFSAPTSDGGSGITNYVVNVLPVGTYAIGSASPIVVTGLTNGVDYTFTVVAGNGIGSSAVSAVSNTVRPSASTPTPTPTPDPTPTPTPTPASNPMRNSGGGGSVSMLLLFALAAVVVWHRLRYEQARQCNKT
jgi:hypothetical protein